MGLFSSAGKLFSSAEKVEKPVVNATEVAEKKSVPLQLTEPKLIQEPVQKPAPSFADSPFRKPAVAPATEPVSEAETAPKPDAQTATAGPDKTEPPKAGMTFLEKAMGIGSLASFVLPFLPIGSFGGGKNGQTAQSADAGSAGANVSGAQLTDSQIAQLGAQAYAPQIAPPTAQLTSPGTVPQVSQAQLSAAQAAQIRAQEVTIPGINPASLAPAEAATLGLQGSVLRPPAL